MRTVRGLLLGSFAAACLAAAAPAGAAPFVYVSSWPGDAFTFDTAGGALAMRQIVSAGSGVAGGVAVTPDGTSVYVTNFNQNLVYQYDVAADGTLTAKTTPTVKTGGSPFAIAVNPDGRAAYVVNADDGTVSQYDIGPGGALSPTIPPTATAGRLPSGVAVTPDGKSVYVTDCNDNTVSQYSVGAGDTLAPKTHPTVPTGACPRGIAVTPDGKNVYVTDFGAGAVSQYDIGSDGALTPKTTPKVATGTQPIGIALSPDGQSAYVADSGDGTIAQYAASATGLTLKTPQTIGAGTNPTGVIVSRDGRNVYVTDYNTGHIGGAGVLQYAGGNGPGTLSPLSPGVVGAGAPFGIAAGPAQIRFSCGGVIRDCAVNIVPITGGGGTTTAVIIRTNVVRAAPIGILVQRIVGNRLIRVGKVPFGLKRTGRVKVRWSLRVNGHGLPAGRYRITLRMFDRHQHLIAFAQPVVITIR
jgi:DNA-binding beta-propeller fold protein YncE